MEELSKYLAERHKPEDINSTHKKNLSLQERIALGSTNIIGTMYAVYIILLAIAGWMIWQSYLASKPFDPYPFAFLLFIGSVIQLPLMSLIMVGQNLQGRHSQLRAEEEFRATESSSRDIEKILIHLNAQDKAIRALSEKIDQRLSKSS